MIWSTRVRSLVGTPLCIAILATASASFGQAAKKPKTEAQAQLLDQAQFACVNCFFGATKQFYCFEANNQILIGYQKIPTMNWDDSSKNFLTPVHPTWTAWRAAAPALPITYDAKHIYVQRVDPKQYKGFLGDLKGFAFWATRANSKRAKLTRTSMSDVFSNDQRCHAAGAPVKTR
ncbi:MAG TPA: hypothetical protein VHW24_00760 [Bryobacteraceae bacterium]|jgi:hypothetical protein|nr:hypothetical protein [Bryobacteraceae bacterium]